MAAAASGASTTRGRSDLAVLETSLRSFQESQRRLLHDFESGMTKLDDSFRNLDQCIESHREQEDELRRLEAMLKEVRKLNPSEEEQQRMNQLEQELVRAKEALDGIKETKPQRASHFIRFMMGKVSLKMWKKADQIRFRAEYDKFKLRTTWVFILFPLVQLFVTQADLLWVAHQVWLLYYYQSLALRENVLAQNGSAIQSWWIYHHYITMAISGVSIVYNKERLAYVTYFLWFCLAQGIVMVLQTRYQSRRHYVRRSLGKAKDVDVSSTETIVEKPTDLKLLVPLLVLIYIAEFSFAFYMLTMFDNVPVQVMGALFFCLGAGNSITTGRVLLRKRRRRRTNTKQKER